MFEVDLSTTKVYKRGSMSYTVISGEATGKLMLHYKDDPIEIKHAQLEFVKDFVSSVIEAMEKGD